MHLWGPDKITADDDPSLPFMGTLATSREAVLCVSLPHKMLWPISKEQKEGGGNKAAAALSCEKLRIVPYDVLEAMTSFKFSNAASSGATKTAKKSGEAAPFGRSSADSSSHDSTASRDSASTTSLSLSTTSNLRQSEGSSISQQQKKHILALPTSSCLLRAFRLKEATSAPRHRDAELLRDGASDPFAAGAAMQEVWQPATCKEYISAMADVRQQCEDEGSVPMYHYTDPRFAKSILSGGLRMSTQGQVSDYSCSLMARIMVD